jgi:hypothetical protein
MVEEYIASNFNADEFCNREMNNAQEEVRAKDSPLLPLRNF